MGLLEDDMNVTREEFLEHQRREEAWLKGIDGKADMNTANIAKLTASIEKLVQVQRDLEGVIRIGAGTQKLFLWLLKWGFIGAGLVSAAKWVLEHFIGKGWP